MRKNLVSFCCGGVHCHENDPVFYNSVPSLDDIEGQVVVWLRMGREEAYVMNRDKPGNLDGQWRVIKELTE
jgi:hypothetical protein